jgi:1,4-alpha-glucan branching enzyme
VINSDSEFYGGSNLGNGYEPLHAEQIEWMQRPYSLTLTVPPLGCVVLEPVGG